MIKINLSLLGNVFSKVSDIKNNLTSTDTDKPLSAAQGKELKTQVDTKVNKVTGKELSSNDFTDSLKNKLENDVLSANFGYIDENLKMHFTVASLDLDVDDDIIQEGEKTNVQATLTDDKEEPIEGIRVNFYELYTPTISLSGNSIIQSGQRADITAKVKDSDGSIVAGETVYFFESTTYRCIGKGVTDDNGIAHITHSSNDNGATFTQSASNGYLGTGKGQIGVFASMDKKLVDGSIVSETYSILDCIKYDKGILDDPQTNDIYDTRDANSLLTRTSEYSKLTEVTTGNALLWLFNLPSECTVDFEFMQVDGTNSNHSIRVHNNTSYKTSFALYNLGYDSSIIGQWIKLRLTITDGSATLTSLDDTSKTKTNTFSGTGNRWSISTTDNISELRIRNVKVYPI